MPSRTQREIVTEEISERVSTRLSKVVMVLGALVAAALWYFGALPLWDLVPGDSAWATAALPIAVASFSGLLYLAGLGGALVGYWLSKRLVLPTPGVN